MRSYSTCSGHQHSGSISWKSSVGSTRGRFLAMRFPLDLGQRRPFSRSQASYRGSPAYPPPSEHRDDFPEIQKTATDGISPQRRDSHVSTTASVGLSRTFILSL